MQQPTVEQLTQQLIQLSSERAALYREHMDRRKSLSRTLVISKTAQKAEEIGLQTSDVTAKLARNQSQIMAAETSLLRATGAEIRAFRAQVEQMNRLGPPPRPPEAVVGSVFAPLKIREGAPTWVIGVMALAVIYSVATRPTSGAGPSGRDWLVILLAVVPSLISASVDLVNVIRETRERRANRSVVPSKGTANAAD